MSPGHGEVRALNRPHLRGAQPRSVPGTGHLGTPQLCKMAWVADRADDGITFGLVHCGQLVLIPRKFSDRMAAFQARWHEPFVHTFHQRSCVNLAEAAFRDAPIGAFSARVRAATEPG